MLSGLMDLLEMIMTCIILLLQKTPNFQPKWGLFYNLDKKNPILHDHFIVQLDRAVNGNNVYMNV